MTNIVTYPTAPQQNNSFTATSMVLRDFEGALYIHLTRHPYGTINSIEKLRLEQDLFGHIPHFTSRELAEYTWLISHENILSFLQEEPKIGTGYAN